MESGDKGSLTYGKLLLAGDDLEPNLDSPLSNVLLREGLVLYRGQQGHKGGFQKLRQARDRFEFWHSKISNLRRTQRLGIEEDRNQRG
jgi:hypothetical protein